MHSTDSLTDASLKLLSRLPLPPSGHTNTHTVNPLCTVTRSKSPSRNERRRTSRLRTSCENVLSAILPLRCDNEVRQQWHTCSHVYSTWFTMEMLSQYYSVFMRKLSSGFKTASGDVSRVNKDVGEWGLKERKGKTKEEWGREDKNKWEDYKRQEETHA